MTLSVLIRTKEKNTSSRLFHADLNRTFVGTTRLAPITMSLISSSSTGTVEVAGKFMSKRTLIDVSAFAIFSVFEIVGLFQARAQQAQSQQSVPGGRISLQTLKDSLDEANQEVQRLQHFLEASTVDSRILRNTNVKSWRISNPEIRDSLFAALMQADSSVQSEAGADALVLATSTDDLIEVRFGNSVFKGMTLKDAIDRSGDRNLYRKIAASYRYSRDIEMRDPSVRLSTPIQAVLMSNTAVIETFAPTMIHSWKNTPDFAVELRLNEFAFAVGPHWGAAIDLGFEDFNLPFWSAGTIQALVTYDHVRVGAVLPFVGGRFESNLFPPFTLRARKLNGARGITASADFGIVGGSFTVLRLTKSDMFGLTNPADFFYPTGFASLYYSFAIALDRENYARARFGFGTYRIDESSITPSTDKTPETLNFTRNSVTFSPIIQFEYIVRDERERFRAGLRFFDLTISLYGSMEIIPDILSVEASYVWPITPDLQTWQNPDFFLITPKFRLAF